MLEGCGGTEMLGRQMSSGLIQTCIYVMDRLDFDMKTGPSDRSKQRTR